MDPEHFLCSPGRCWGQFKEEGAKGCLLPPPVFSQGTNLVAMRWESLGQGEPQGLCCLSVATGREPHGGAGWGG